MEDKRLIYLYQKFSTRTATKTEVEEFEAYLNTQESQQHLIGLLEEDYIKQENLLGEMSPDSDQRIYKYVIDQPQELSSPAVTRRLWPRIAIAAAIATIVFGAGLFYYNSSDNTDQTEIAYKNDVNPGAQSATLTLASGKKIRLSDAVNGELAKEAGVVITKSADGRLIYELKDAEGGEDKINTLSTANGETYQLRLPDGSMVYLNAASSLTYAASLMENGKRVVSLQGEGFFEIAKDKKHPFVVKTASQDVQVLGTHFNVMAYDNEGAVATTLVEGSVKVLPRLKSGGAVTEKVLKPGEQALNDGGSIKISEANLENITDWKDGDFYFERVDFRMVMRKIARWYDVEVIYDADVPEDIQTGGWMSRTNKLSAVLRSIEKSGLVHFKIEGRKIYVSK